MPASQPQKVVAQLRISCSADDLTVLSLCYLVSYYSNFMHTFNKMQNLLKKATIKVLTLISC